MKKRIIYAVILVIALATAVYAMVPGVVKSNSGTQYIIEVIDGCEYVFPRDNMNFGFHKGNCKYCAERRQKELEFIIHAVKTVDKNEK